MENLNFRHSFKDLVNAMRICAELNPQSPPPPVEIIAFNEWIYFLALFEHGKLIFTLRYGSGRS
jgi:hypothetical protein